MESQPNQMADAVASLIAGTGRIEHKGQVHAVMARLPIYTVSKLDAIANRTGKSRTGAMQLLLSVGWEEVTSRLSEPLLEQLLLADAEAMAKLLDEDKSSQVVL